MMSATKRRIAARRRAWGRGPHLLSFVRPEEQSPATIPIATGLFLAFPAGERHECPVVDEGEPQAAAAPVALIAADGRRRHFPVDPPAVDARIHLRLHETMAN